MQFDPGNGGGMPMGGGGASDGASGVMGGASTGSSFGPWGALIGAVLGGVQGNEKAKQAAKMQKYNEAVIRNSPWLKVDMAPVEKGDALGSAAQGAFGGYDQVQKYQQAKQTDAANQQLVNSQLQKDAQANDLNKAKIDYYNRLSAQGNAAPATQVTGGY